MAAPARRPRSRLDELLRDTIRYHVKNPVVWKLFCRFALRAAQGTSDPRFKAYGARLIFERIRWEVNVELFGVDGTRLRLNDHYSSYYGRAFELCYPEHAGLFRKRELKSAKRPPRGRESVDPDLTQHELLFEAGETVADEALRGVFARVDAE